MTTTPRAPAAPQLQVVDPHLEAIDIWALPLATGKSATSYSPVANSDDELRASRLRFPADRAALLARRGFLRSVLAQYVEQDPQQLRISRRCGHCADPGHGKPHLLDHPEVHFSAAATSTIAVVAVSTQGAIGIDVEQPANVDAEGIPDLVTTAFSPQEAVMFGLTGHRVTPTDFAWAFARKEAIGKADGRGLLVDVAAIAVDWTATPLSFGDQYVGALATCGPPRISLRDDPR